MRRPAAVAAVALLAAVALGAGCADGDDEEAFCERLRSTSVDDLLDRFDAQDPAGSAAAFSQAADQLDDLAGDAPSDVEEPVRELAEVVDELAEGLRDVDRDDATGALVVLDGVSDRAADLERAGDELAAYAAGTCGVTLDTMPATSAPATTPTTAGPATTTTTPTTTATTPTTTATTPTTSAATATTATTAPPPTSGG